ncbi:MAG: SUF system Fe-S cluster assembly regulator [Planctomycetota bacterium JB042]
MTRQSDYAIVLLSVFAHDEPGASHAARDLAERTHLPVPMVAKILKTLAREGVLLSQRGVHGGYRLARPPAEISVSDVITALEGPIGITECTTDEPTGCDIAALCAVKSNWATINQVVRDALDGITLEQMAGPLHSDHVSGNAS